MPARTAVLPMAALLLTMASWLPCHAEAPIKYGDGCDYLRKHKPPHVTEKTKYNVLKGACETISTLGSLCEVNDDRRFGQCTAAEACCKVVNRVDPFGESSDNVFVSTTTLTVVCTDSCPTGAEKSGMHPLSDAYGHECNAGRSCACPILRKRCLYLYSRLGGSVSTLLWGVRAHGTSQVFY